MKTKIENKKTIIIELEEQEARWLKNIMQNPLYCDNPADEEKSDKEMRHLFWESLKGI